VTIHVIKPGLLTTVQDLGRRGHQQEGIPESGAMDSFAHRVANQLVGNPDEAATLEMTLSGPTLRFESDALIALAGAEQSASIHDRLIPTWRPVAVRAGSVLACGAVTGGCRAYLAVAGGIDVPPVLGSRSTYMRAAIGGLDGRMLKPADVLPTATPPPLGNRIAARLARGDAAVSVAKWGVGRSLRPRYGGSPTVRVLAGAHTQQLTSSSRDAFLRAEFRIGSQSDRMGYRLEGPALELSASLELLSEAVAFGTVQLPPNGNPIVLMADRQTTGGYPRIGEVATVDLPLLAQLKPGDAVRFRAISLDEAQSLYLARERDLQQSRQAVHFLSLGSR
jgi:antagonist of KipI